MKNQNIVIIGGGCSGVLSAIHLLAQTKNPINLTIIEKKPQIGHGIAYSTTYPEHLLNVPAGNMSALFNNPQHLLDWLAKRQIPSAPETFIPRQQYAAYLQDSLHETKIAANKIGSTLQIIQDEVLNLDPENTVGWQITTSNNLVLKADAVILAIGNFLPANKNQYISNPWEIDLNKIPVNSKVAIIGSGLSTVDMLLALNKNQHKNQITVYSSNGMLPVGHDIESFKFKPSIDWSRGLSVIELFKQFRADLELYRAHGYNWHSLIDSLRPHTQTIWQRWDTKNKKRFLRHLKSKWDYHRHRIAPEIAHSIQQLHSQKFFTIHRSKVLNVSQGPAVKVTSRNFINGLEATADFDLVINCSGLISDYTKAESKLLINLFAKKRINPGPLNKGIAAESSGKIVENLYTIGFPLHGLLWESIAVPELRMQANNLAKTLVHNS